ncbi:Biphenyl dioxygenase subunit beta [Geodia barretti]|uniref:Biphenyl dioxygenase subunit beta n=2 Tax=Geodia barretti TaxID=519541 RepID=A0AA35SAI8_GEOBA|nr:Biphenyl dioxygenase subunit beta [Geodia barretti]
MLSPCYCCGRRSKPFFITKPTCWTNAGTTNGWNCSPPMIRYWVPLRRNVKFGELEREFTRQGQDINWFDEGKETLTQRVNQIQTGVHWAEEPLSRLAHLVTNVEIIDAQPDAASADEVSIRCRFIIYRNRVATETDILVGRREDTLRREDGQLRISSRKVVLDQNVLLAKNLTFFF